MTARSSSSSGELALLLLVSLPFLFFGLRLSFLDPDEGLYGDIARGMLLSGDWVLPRFNALPYLEKPPLFFWLAALTLGLAGPSESAVRPMSGRPRPTSSSSSA